MMAQAKHPARMPATTLPGISRRWRVQLVVSLAAALSMIVFEGLSGAAVASAPFLGGLATVSQVSSTVPANGDVNPYGIAVVPRTVGRLQKGDVLISNFNNSANLQGLGTTIVEISPTGSVGVFATIDPSSRAGRACGGVGLTTALAVLHSGWVVVGSLPTSDGTAATATAGCLFVLDANGRVVRTITGGEINGPWDLTALDQGDGATLFVSNVLNGTVAGKGSVVNRGTVVRVELSWRDGQAPQVQEETVIGSGFPERTDPSALVVGPTGVGLAGNGTLYVADTVGNRIAAIPNAVERDRTAFTGNDVSANGALNGPLGLAVAPNGHILTVNGGDGNVVETTPSGSQVAQVALDSTGNPPGAGTLFGLAVAPDGKSLLFVDDGSNTLNLLR
jgi:hypothetical protein